MYINGIFRDELLYLVQQVYQKEGRASAIIACMWQWPHKQWFVGIFIPRLSERPGPDFDGISVYLFEAIHFCPLFQAKTQHRQKGDLRNCETFSNQPPLSNSTRPLSSPQARSSLEPHNTAGTGLEMGRPCSEGSIPPLHRHICHNLGFVNIVGASDVWG